LLNRKERSTILYSSITKVYSRTSIIISICWIRIFRKGRISRKSLMLLISWSWSIRETRNISS